MSAKNIWLWGVFLMNTLTSAVASAAAFNMLSCCPGENTATQARFVWNSDEEFSDAYLLNFDITKGEFTYTFKISGVDVTEDSVKVGVTLVRSGAKNGEINGTLNFYGAKTLEAFKSGGSLVGTVKLANDEFGDAETATATIQKDDNVFFNAKIENGQ